MGKLQLRCLDPNQTKRKWLSIGNQQQNRIKTSIGNYEGQNWPCGKLSQRGERCCKNVHIQKQKTKRLKQ